MASIPEEGKGRLLIAGGGTGGHLFPGIAVARQWMKKNKLHEVLFVTGRRKIESDILQNAGFQQVSITVEGIKGRSWSRKIMTLFNLPRSLFQSLSIIRDYRPDVVLGVGGYSAGPVCLASRILGIPTVIHEQNSYPGLTNRLLSRIAHRALISFDESRTYLKSDQVILTGNPIRPELLETKEKERESGPFRLLVMGGSQGAKFINRTFAETLKILKETGTALEVIHQTGGNDYEEILEVYRKMGVEAVIQPFIEDMQKAYSWADLVINRAGASTVSELAALGKPSILIPYPFASNNHQEVNAQLLAGKGGAFMVLEKDLDPEKLAGLIRKIMDNPDELRLMGRRAEALGRPQAAEKIVEQLMEISAR